LKKKIVSKQTIKLAGDIAAPVIEALFIILSAVFDICSFDVLSSTS
jgi:hypothetical protein